MHVSHKASVVFILIVCVLVGGVTIIQKKSESKTEPVVFSSDKKITQTVVSEKILPSELTLMIAGDVMFDRKIRWFGEKNGYDSLLASIAPLFSRADIAVVNLEGPITSFPSKTLFADGTLGKDFIFTFDPQVADVLARAHIDVVSLANNHTDNFGADGLRQTREYLDESGVRWFGDPWNQAGTEAIIVKNDISVAFVGYHAFQLGFSRALEDVRRLAGEGHFVVVMPHWGPEYVSQATDDMRDQALDLVNAGAGLIVGAHPHVVMNQEWIGPVPVFYSVGNLLFDQYFSPEVMKGNIVEVVLEKNPKTKKVFLGAMKIHETSLTSRTHVEVVQ